MPFPRAYHQGQPLANEHLSHAAAAAAEPLSLAKAIELALEGNPEVAAAKRQWEATEGQVLQGRSRPNPELAYSLEDTRSKTRTQSWQLNLPVELGGKRAARTKAAEKRASKHKPNSPSCKPPCGPMSLPLTLMF